MNKNTACKTVQSFKLADNETTQFLRYLAEQYDNKNFMPDIGQVRLFLEGLDLFSGVPKDTTVKSRNMCTRRIFEKLKNLSLAELQALEYSGHYDPPKRLETYARAIENFGRRVRRPG